MPNSRSCWFESWFFRSVNYRGTPTKVLSLNSQSGPRTGISEVSETFFLTKEKHCYFPVFPLSGQEGSRGKEFGQLLSCVSATLDLLPLSGAYGGWSPAVKRALALERGLDSLEGQGRGKISGQSAEMWVYNVFAGSGVDRSLMLQFESSMYRTTRGHRPAHGSVCHGRREDTPRERACVQLCIFPNTLHI